MRYLLSLLFLVVSLSMACSCSHNLSDHHRGAAPYADLTEHHKSDTLIYAKSSYQYKVIQYELSPSIWVKYPVFYSRTIDKNLNQLNILIEDMALEYMEFPREMQAKGDYRVIFDVKCCGSNLISIFITSFCYWENSVHAVWDYGAINYRLEDGKMLTLSDYYDSNDPTFIDSVGKLQYYINPSPEKNAHPGLPETFPDAYWIDPELCYFTDTKAGIHFLAKDPSGSSIGITFEVPYENLKKYQTALDRL